LVLSDSGKIYVLELILRTHKMILTSYLRRRLKSSEYRICACFIGMMENGINREFKIIPAEYLRGIGKL